MTKLEAYLAIAPELKNFYTQEVSVGIYDTEKLRAYYPGPNLNLGLSEGELIPEGTPVQEVLQTGKSIARRLCKEKFGIALVTIVNPIFEEGKVVGAIGVDISIEAFDDLLNMGAQILHTVEQATTTVRKFSSYSDRLQETMEHIQDTTNKLKETVQETHADNKKINHLSFKTDILGLDAAMNAVVSGINCDISLQFDEFRLLAKNTKSVSDQMTTKLNDAEMVLDEMMVRIHDLSNDSYIKVSECAKMAELLDQVVGLARNMMDKGTRNSLSIAG